MRTGAVSAGIFAALVFSASGQPTLTQAPRDTIALYGSIVTFAVQAQSDTPLRYQWQFNGTDIRNARTRALRVYAVPSRVGDYSVRVTDTNGNSTFASAHLDAVRRPIIVAQPRSAVVGVHKTATFTARVNDSGPYTRMIWHNYNPSEGPHEIPSNLGFRVDQTTLTIPNCLENDSYNGLYWLAITNGAAGTVTVRPKLTVVGAPTLTDEPQDATVGRGGTVLLRVGVAPDASPWHRFQWYKEGTAIPGATRYYLRLVRMQPENSGNYYCIVSSIGGETPSWGAQITVAQ